MSMTKLNFKLISIKGRTNMFEKKSSTTDQTNTTEDSFNVLILAAQYLNSGIFKNS